jgi:hypothetical protein
MASKYQLMIDPTPRGWMYGFPRPLPDEAVDENFTIKTDFDLTEWVCSFGYPEDSFQYYRLYPQEVHDKCGTPECCGTCETSEKTDNQEVQYYYPGSDPQE